VVFLELLTISRLQQCWRVPSGTMYALICIIIILFAVWYCVAVLRKVTFLQLRTETGYLAYYYLLGAKGILEDYVYSGHNKARMYIKTIS
jgi:hypothetical protein